MSRRPESRRWRATLTAMLALAMLGAERVDENIEAHRQSDVRVIVLDDRGRPVEGATVRIEQQRHDFALGFTAPDTGWPAALDGDDPFKPSDQPLWRCFNAVALGEAGDWSRMSPEPGAEPNVAAIAALVDRARRAGLRVRFGTVISADLGRNPDWLAELDADDGPALVAALDRRLEEALRDVPGEIEQFDLYTHVLDHELVERRLGPAALRGLFERARALRPGAAMQMRFDDALLGPRRHRMGQRVVALRDAFVPVDRVAIRQRFRQPQLRGPLGQSLEALEGLGVRAVLVDLELGGPSEGAAAYNAEVVLRAAFASPVIEGIWLGALTADAATAPHAALFDAHGEPTDVGRVVDRLFRETWWTDHQAKTDRLGNVRARVFAGVHRVSGVWPDGRERAITVHVPLDDAERVVLLEP